MITNDGSKPESIVTEAQVRRLVQPLVEFLAAPKDLIGFWKIGPELYKILDLFLPLADEPTARQLDRLKQVLARILSGEIALAQIFPLAAAEAFKSRKGLTDYYRTNPHYCIYYHRAEDQADVPRYQALLASLLPVTYQLERARLNGTEPTTSATYQFCLYLRQLTNVGGKERLILRELPAKSQHPQVLARQLVHLTNRFDVSRDEGGNPKRFQYIARMIEWYLTGTWDRRSGSGNRSHPTLRSSPNHGALETLASERRVSLPIPLGEQGVLQVAKYFDRPDPATARHEAFDRWVEQDVTPTAITVQLSPQRTAVHFMANRRRLAKRNARYAAQAIEMSNQHLLVTRSSLSGHEIRIFLSSIDDLSGNEWQGFEAQERAAIAAWAACRFFLGQSEGRLKGMVRATSSRAMSADVVWNAAESAFILRASNPEHAPPPAVAAGHTVTVTQMFQLRVSDRIVRLLKRLPEKSVVLFHRSRENEFASLIKQLNDRHAINLTPARLSAVIPGLMSELAPADRVIASYFLGLPPNHHNPAVYSAVPVRQIQNVFNQAIDLVERRTGRMHLAPENASLALHSAVDDHVGSLHVPRKDKVRGTVAKLKEQVARLAVTPIASLAQVHNAYTAYVTFFLLATTGVRAVSTLLPVVSDIDAVTGFCFMSDKDSEHYRNARYIWLHPEMLLQLDRYAEHVIRLRQHLAMSRPVELDKIDARTNVPWLSSHLKPDRTADLGKLAQAAPVLFMLGERSNEILPVLPSHLVKYVGGEWELRLGALRHFVRTQLLLAGCSGEIINATIGHSDRGEGAWNIYSTLPPSLWRDQISDAMRRCMLLTEFDVIPSPLFGDTSA